MPQRLGQPRRRILLHDARRTLGADHALVERVVRIAVDVAHLTVAQMHEDAATAGEHVAGGLLDLLEVGFCHFSFGRGKCLMKRLTCGFNI